MPVFRPARGREDGKKESEKRKSAGLKTRHYSGGPANPCQTEALSLSIVYQPNWLIRSRMSPL